MRHCLIMILLCLPYSYLMWKSGKFLTPSYAMWWAAVPFVINFFYFRRVFQIYQTWCRMTAKGYDIPASWLWSATLFGMVRGQRIPRKCDVEAVPGVDMSKGEIFIVLQGIMLESSRHSVFVEDEGPQLPQIKK
ncbi:hypothetical protein BH09SUM1_BH09SUM1_18480 [soil metagenome]